MTSTSSAVFRRSPSLRRCNGSLRRQSLLGTRDRQARPLYQADCASFLHLKIAGVLAFALNYLPYIGSLIVTAVLPRFALVQFGSFETPLLVLLRVSLIQVVIGSYLEPVFSGSALSISPPLMLFSIALWTFLWGALGAFMGVPLMIVALTLFDEFPSTRWVADILSGGRVVIN